MCVISTRVLCLIFSIILPIGSNNSESNQILPINVVDVVNKIEKFIDSEKDIPKLVNEISDIITQGGLEKYKSGCENEDKDLNITQLIKKYRGPSEEHHVRTTDGYILTLFRIPTNGTPIFLMHGILLSSDDWVTAGPKNALPYLLAEQGYDVWIGNARGTKHSRHHEHLSPSKAEFWDFSWDEIGRHDLPASIDYVLQVTGYKQLKYVGHSQGTTSFFVMCSERPEYNDKVSVMIALAPAAFLSNIISPIIRLLVPFRRQISFLAAVFGLYEFLPSDILIRTLTRGVCGNTEFAKLTCSNVMFLFGGFSYSQLNVENMPVVFSHTPGGCAFKQLVHYAQAIGMDSFRRYNYGKRKNLEIYGSLYPPDYRLEKTTTSVAIIYSQGDWFVNVKDAEKTAKNLTNVVDFYEVPVKTFSHVDFLWAKDVKMLVYLRVLKILDRF